MKSHFLEGSTVYVDLLPVNEIADDLESFLLKGIALNGDNIVSFPFWINN